MSTNSTPDPAPPERRIAGVHFYPVGKLYYFSSEHLPDLRVGDYVIVETSRGRQLGQIMLFLTPEEDDTEREYKPILRLATPVDLMQQKIWRAREDEALQTCQAKAAALGGLEDAKFVAAQYNYDGSLLTFLFSAEEKLNTSKLRSTLQRSFKAKVEVRQIGPRDVAKLLGGMGACGLERCCATFLADFSPISIKMAKAQGISLNPSEITGMCGRLRCCLIYEYEQYVEARGKLPKRNKRIGTPYGEGKVIDVHPLRDSVTVLVGEVRHEVPREEIIPLEEWAAMQEKAALGCAVSAGGACEARARRAEKPSERPAPRQEQKSTPATQENAAKAEDKPREGKSGRSKSRRTRRGRKRRPRNKKPNTSA